MPKKQRAEDATQRSCSRSISAAKGDILGGHLISAQQIYSICAPIEGMITKKHEKNAVQGNNKCLGSHVGDAAMV